VAGAPRKSSRAGSRTKPHRRRSGNGRKVSNRRAPARKKTGTTKRYWSGEVTRNSNALDLERSVFTLSDPRKVALSLKRSAERSTRRKATPYQSAMSMLTFYINRAGKSLPASQKAVLSRAKDELRKVFHRA
jgi:hypothetical protein